MMKMEYDVRTIQTLNKDFVRCINKVEGFLAWELIPSKQKSYYTKAFVVANRFGMHYLFSYQTLVACYDCVMDTFYRCYSDYSVTTMNHINDFRMDNGLLPMSKHEWLELPVITDNHLLFPSRCLGTTIDNDTYNRLFAGTPYFCQ